MSQTISSVETRQQPQDVRRQRLLAPRLEVGARRPGDLSDADLPPAPLLAEEDLLGLSLVNSDPVLVEKHVVFVLDVQHLLAGDLA